MPISFYIGLRYLRTKRRNGFVSFISAISMLGMMLGVMVLVVVLSVMNGFDYQIKHRFFSVAPEITVMTNHSVLKTWPQLAKQVEQEKGVTGAAPFISGKGMLSHQGEVSGVEVLGVLPKQESRISAISQKMVAGKWQSLQAGEFHIVLGKTLAKNLGLLVGSHVTLLTPQATNTPFGILPRYKTFTVSGIFNVGAGFGFDNSVAFINMANAAKLYAGTQLTSGLHVRVSDLYAAPAIALQLQNQLPFGFLVGNWTQTYGAFFHALAMEKTMMFIILLLIVAVAAFNLVASLVMAVNDKRADIAILRALGATRWQIMGVFIVQGGCIGLIGTLIGLFFGVMLAWNATAIVNELQRLFHVHFISSSVYFINYLPSRLEWGDVLWVCVTAVCMSLFATLYPAWRASQVQPAEALKHE